MRSGDGVIDFTDYMDACREHNVEQRRMLCDAEIVRE